MYGVIRGLQKNALIAKVLKLVIGEVPLLNKDSKAVTRDSIALNPGVQGNFMQMMKSAIDSEVAKVVVAPFQQMKALEFQGDTDIASTYNQNVSGLSGVTNSVIYGSTVRQNAIETEISNDVDCMEATSVYPYFNAFMNYQINKRLEDARCEYRFDFAFEGSNSYLDRKRRLDTQITLMGQGIVNPQKIIAAATGQNFFKFQAQMDEARINGWVDNLTPIIPGAQLSGGSSGAGRPSKSDSEIGEAGIETKSAGSNIEKGGSI
jgi:hypothetical protein